MTSYVGGVSRHWRPAFAVVVAVALVVTLPTLPVAADPSLEDLRDERRDAERRHSELSAEQQAAEERLDEIQAAFSLAVEEYNEAEESLAAMTSKLSLLEDEVAGLLETVGEHESQIGHLVSDLYKSGGEAASYEALLGTEDAAEATQRHGYLRSLQRSQTTRIEVYLADRDVLDRQQADLDAARERRVSLTEELDERRREVEERVTSQAEELAELEAVVAGADDELAVARSAEQSEEARLEEEALEREREQEEERRAVARADRSERDAAADESSPAPPAPSPESTSSPSPDEASSDAGNPGSAAQAAVQAALGQTGTPYVWGGNTPSGFDCSGLTSWAYAQAGVSIPRTSGAQYAGLPKVSRSELQPGDLLFFNSPISHVGMYIGNGQMVEAPYTGTNVRVRSIVRGGYVGATRPTG